MPADLPPELARVHLIGMGGAGMSGIARLLLARGGVVSGSDARDSRVLAALRPARRHRSSSATMPRT